MDPNVTLARLRAALKIIDNCDEGEDIDVDTFDELVSCITTLDEWLSNGGLWPDDWIKVM